MVSQKSVKIGLGNGLLPDSTKPLPESMLTLRWGFCGIHMRANSVGNVQDKDPYSAFENYTFKFIATSPRANELMGKWCRFLQRILLTHWGRVTHICDSKLTIIGSDNGLSPSRHQAIIWTNAWILLIRPSGTNFSEILIEIDAFSFGKTHLKMSSAKCRPFCLSLNVLNLLTNRG